LVSWKGPTHLFDSSLNCCIFINIPGSTPVFPGVLPAAEGEPTYAIKKPRQLSSSLQDKPVSKFRHHFKGSASYFQGILAGRRHLLQAYEPRLTRSPGVRQ